MAYIRDYYGIPAKRGMRIFYQYSGKHGLIVGSSEQYLRVRFTGEKIVRTLHPTWCIKYPKQVDK